MNIKENDIMSQSKVEFAPDVILRKDIDAIETNILDKCEDKINNLEENLLLYIMRIEEQIRELKTVVDGYKNR